MKKLMAMATAGVLAMGAIAYSTKVHATTERAIDEAQVNAKVDARLKVVLAGLLADAQASRGHSGIAGR